MSTTTIPSTGLVTVEVPARVVNRLRDELYGCISCAAAELASAADKHDVSEIRLKLSTIQQHEALLDALGWDVGGYENDFKLSADDTIEITAGTLALADAADFIAGGARDDLDGVGVNDTLHPDERAIAEMCVDLADRFLRARELVPRRDRRTLDLELLAKEDRVRANMPRRPGGDA